MGMGKAKAQPADAGAPTTITEGTEIIGNIKSTGSVRINGILKGNISADGTLYVGPQGVIEGNVTCANSTVLGKVQGKVIVKGLLGLKATANIKGEIITSKLSIEPGALFTGTCNMDGDNGGKREIGSETK